MELYQNLAVTLINLYKVIDFVVVVVAFFFFQGNGAEGHNMVLEELVDTFTKQSVWVKVVVNSDKSIWYR